MFPSLRPIYEPTTPPPPPNIFPRKVRTKMWGEDAVMVHHGYTTAKLNSGNFQVVGLLVEDESGLWGADQVGHRVVISRELTDWLYNIQVPDNYNAAQKMNWLCQYRSRPYLLESDSWNWKDAPYIYFGVMCYGGQFLEITGEMTVFGTYREDKRQNLDCYVVRAFTLDDLAAGVTHESNPELIQLATAAFKTAQAEDVYTDHPRGYIRGPLWAPSVGRFQGLGGYQPDKYLIPKNMVVELT